jgi:hypothetical protein
MTAPVMVNENGGLLIEVAVPEVEGVGEETTTMRGIHSERNLSDSGTAEETRVDLADDRVASVTEVVLEALREGVKLLKDKPRGVSQNQASSTIAFELFDTNRSPGLHALAHKFSRPAREPWVAYRHHFQKRRGTISPRSQPFG